MTPITATRNNRPYICKKDPQKELLFPRAFLAVDGRGSITEEGERPSGRKCGGRRCLLPVGQPPFLLLAALAAVVVVVVATEAPQPGHAGFFCRRPEKSHLAQRCHIRALAGP